jgi:hypothetical protein
VTAPRTRRQLLEESARVALAAAGAYAAIDALGTAPARAAAVARRLPPEQHLLRGVRIVVDEGIRVVVPPLHHQVVTARLLVRGRPQLQEARRALEHALRALERRHAATPSGLGVTVAWGLPYFREHVSRLRDGRRYPDYLPRDLEASRAAGRPVPAVLDAIRFPSDGPEVLLEDNHLAILLRSDSAAHVRDGGEALVRALSGAIAVTSIRRGFVGRGFGGRRSLTKELAVRAGIPGADEIPDSSQLFLGFTSSHEAGLGPGRIANFETLPRLTDQWPNGTFRHGTTMHLSHLFEDVERWYGELGFFRRIWNATDAGRFAEIVQEGTTTLPMGPETVQSQEEVVHFATIDREGLVGHSGSMHPVNRLSADVRDNYGVRRPRGTALLQRVDFNTLDNPFAWSSRPRRDAMRGTPAAGLHFVAFAPTSDLFHRMRLAMDGRYADGTALPQSPRSMQLGMNGVIRSTHRQNFLVPPRRHRSFPLADAL